ncbi:Uncharacterised protein [Vibrio cholerae]|nr:Uncharacterised protein [Vibrio cholerae]
MFNPLLFGRVKCNIVTAHREQRIVNLYVFVADRLRIHNTRSHNSPFSYSIELINHSLMPVGVCT